MDYLLDENGYATLSCHLCGGDVKRKPSAVKGKLPTCFECKMKRQRIAAKKYANTSYKNNN